MGTSQPKGWGGPHLPTTNRNMQPWNIGSMSGRGTEVCKELRKKRMDVCCLQEVRWRGQGAWFLGVKGRRYKLWWSGNSDGTGGVGVSVKEELC